MPELPEVETIAQDLNRCIAGRTISQVLVSFQKIVASDYDSFSRLLEDRVIEKVGRLGKWVRFDLDSGAGLLAHLKMTGQFLIGDWPGSLDGPWPPHARAAFLLTGKGLKDETLFYRDIRKFGRLRAFSQSELTDFLQSLGLGPDPFELEAPQFHRILTAKKGQLKAVLLDQAVVSGLGNIYADETLFAANLLPTRAASDLSPAESTELLTQIKRILTNSIKLRGSTVENYQGLDGPGSYQDQHQVYGKSGRACPQCGQLLLKTIIGGRSTVFCPFCQK
ncbi:MAG: bifunctional DNA-formamidopyrimidine glycosylase/DNA-(apurinic or apyrimidinic site) lyase [Deltaproteobacteria bacterium]|jgi:formamidopyrimidine-DNA glycosylase|nr:bifunctional DNA-formamidopyrimidine glycosylase/DNA-(apurinic or apyrimidinic site) lyase [Deltaproteobacteria bacterium]